MTEHSLSQDKEVCGAGRENLSERILQAAKEAAGRGPRPGEEDGQKIAYKAVSYTHLDVYKRQAI